MIGPFKRIDTVNNHTGGGFFSSLFFGGHFWIKFGDSGHIQLAIYTVWDEEPESAVKKCQILEPGGKNKEK